MRTPWSVGRKIILGMHSGIEQRMSPLDWWAPRMVVTRRQSNQSPLSGIDCTARQDRAFVVRGSAAVVGQGIIEKRLRIDGFGWQKSKGMLKLSHPKHWGLCQRQGRCDLLAGLGPPRRGDDLDLLPLAILAGR